MARTAVVPETIDYPDSDGLPMAENEIQLRSILYANSALDNYYRERDDVYVVGNLLLYYEPSPKPGVPGKSVSPDLMVVLGAPKHLRSSYLLWEEPKAPDFVLEISSESTYRADSGTKRDTYAEIGVLEYWQVDPTGVYLRPALQGFRLVKGQYQPLTIRQRADGTLMARSDVLGLALQLNPEALPQEALRFYDPVRGQPLRSLREAEQEREAVEARLGQTEGRLREEQAAREAAEARLQQLEAQLQALRHGRHGFGEEPDNRGM